jgi:hypothetical protein
MRGQLLSAAISTALLVGPGAVLAQHQHGTAPQEQRLGKVHFETSCTPEAQALFDHAMLYQHSFYYRMSQREFEKALQADAQCGIAYWGIALSLLYNPHAPPPPANLPLGYAAIEKGRALGAKTQRERDYLDALATMYADFQNTTHQARIRNHVKAMEACGEISTDPLRARAQHIGVAERQDVRAAAQGRRNLEADYRSAAGAPRPRALHDPSYRLSAARGEGARRSAALRQDRPPDAPHALHMPSHISRASATGRSPSIRTRSRLASPRQRTRRTTSCTLRITLFMPTSNSAKT